MTSLISFVSIKLMEDRQLESKGEAFVQYKREVGSPLLLLPPPLNRALGHFFHGQSTSTMEK